MFRIKLLTNEMQSRKAWVKDYPCFGYRDSLLTYTTDWSCNFRLSLRLLPQMRMEIP